ncbi:MAG TPA: glycoside hydrolase family 5 protein, partial [Paludibacteraceae bacterium]|nr:glycoside hydrolase family 5 protein [Paludibacteraceae bacterium]
MQRASKVLLIVLFSGTIIFPLFSQNERREKNRFISVVEQNLVTPDGEVFLMKGINLGNWLNPEGYMFLFQDVNSYRLIDQALK